jgi:copper(I)-binding protein
MGNHSRLVRRVAVSIGVLLSAACSRTAEVGAAGSSGPIVVERAVAWSAAGLKAATVGMEISNQGDVTDSLIAVTSPAGNATLHSEVPGQGMRPVPVLPLPPRGTLRIGRGLHIMVEDMKAAPATGGTVPVTLRLARGGAIELAVPVMRYTEALTALGE